MFCTVWCHACNVQWQCKMHWICHDTVLFGYSYAQMFEKKTVSLKFVGSLQLTTFWSAFCVFFWQLRHFHIKSWKKICRIFILVHVAKIMNHCRLTIITSPATRAITWRKSTNLFLFLCSTTSCVYCFSFCGHFCLATTPATRINGTKSRLKQKEVSQKRN